MFCFGQLSNVDNVVDHCHYAHRQVVLACSLCSQIMASYTKQEGLILPVSECAGGLVGVNYAAWSSDTFFLEDEVIGSSGISVRHEFSSTLLWEREITLFFFDCMIVIFVLSTQHDDNLKKERGDLCDPPETWYTIILTCLTQQLLLVHHSPFEEPQVDHIVKNVPTFLRSQSLFSYSKHSIIWPSP
jgi:hypothetical protein